MYVYINDILVNAFKIIGISGITSIGRRQYEVALKLYALNIGATDEAYERLNDHELYYYTYSHRMRSKKEDLRPYNTVLDFIDEEYFAVTGEHIYTEDRYKDPKDLNWKILPEAWFFGIYVDNVEREIDGMDRITTKTSDSTCIYSKIYLNYTDAVKARTELSDAVKEIKKSAPRFNV